MRQPSSYVLSGSEADRLSSYSGVTPFGIGSYDADEIEDGTWFTGEWDFDGGTASSTPMKFTYQETRHKFCWWDSPWCMGGTGKAGFLFSTSWYWGVAKLQGWYY